MSKQLLHSKQLKELRLTIFTLAESLEQFDEPLCKEDFKDSIGISPKLYFLDSKLSSDFSDFQHWRYDNFKDII